MLSHQAGEVIKAVPRVASLSVQELYQAARVVQAKVGLVRALRDLHDAHLKHELAVINEVPPCTPQKSRQIWRLTPLLSSEL